MKNLIIAVKIILILVINMSYSQNILKLDEAIRIALNNNFSIQIKKNEVEITKNNFTLGNSGFLPKIELSGSYNSSVNNTNLEFFDGRTTERTGARSGSLNSGLSLNWTLFDGFAMFINYDKLSEINSLSILILKSEIENVLSNLLKIYYGIISQKSILRLTEESLSISAERRYLTELKAQVGSASELEALQSKVDFNEDSSNYLNQKEILNNLKIELNNILARKPLIEFEVEDSISIEETKINELDLKEIVKNNTLVKISEKNIALSDYDYNLVKSSFYPVMHFYGNLGYLNSYSDAGVLKSNTQTGYSFGLNLSFNIFDGFRNSNELENKKIAIDNNKLNHQQIIENIETLYSINISNYKKNLELVKIEKENLFVAKKNLEVARERLNQGVATPLEFREAQRKYIQTNGRLINAKYLAKIFETEILKIAGNLILDY